MQTLFLKIFGEPASKANSRRQVFVHGKSMFIKSAKALSYSKSFKLQAVVPAKQKFLNDVVVTIRIWYASRRPDLDESLILDLLQGVAYENDRQVKEKHIYWMGVDKENPRCEIEIRSLVKD
jgi:Holliday junction resolvase RusA-like endonuclease